MRKPALRVCLLIPTASQWGREVIAGIHNYVRKHSPWQLFVETGSEREYLQIPPGWKGDGIIARINSIRMANTLRKLGIPVVNVSRIRVSNCNFPRVITDLNAVATIAVKHFIDRGFHNFAYFSSVGASYIADHRRAFASQLDQHGYDCPAYTTQSSRLREAEWDQKMEGIATWLDSLPKPIGVFTWNPSSSQLLLHAADWAGLSVPEEVAILSGLDDNLFCEMASLPISGIAAASKTIGHNAAATLDRLIDGTTTRQPPTKIAPLGVVARRSTDTLAIRDRNLAQAVRFIRDHADQLISVQDVLNHVPVSRRTLERLFVQELNRTPAEEIRKVHFERAKHLLEQTDQTEPDIAAASGFGSPEYMIHVFGQRLGLTPMQYRKQIRSR